MRVLYSSLYFYALVFCGMIFLALVTLWVADFSSIYGHGGSWVSGDMARQRTSALVRVWDIVIFWYLAFLLYVVFGGNGVDRVLGRRVVCIPAT